MNRVPYLAIALCLSPLVATSAHAQAWPPLNAEERGNSQTTRVLGVPFTTGYFSYWVRAYRADKVHYSKSNYFESRSWTRGVGPDGVITSSPDRLKIGAFVPLTHDNSAPPLDAVPALPSQRLPALPPLPAIPRVTPLSQVRPLRPLSVSTLPALPPLPSPPNALPPLPRLNR